jgi:hypothetical protein
MPSLTKRCRADRRLPRNRKTVQLKVGADAWDQAQAAQMAFVETLCCNPIEETGDSSQLHLSGERNESNHGSMTRVSRLQWKKLHGCLEERFHWNFCRSLGLLLK